MWEAGYETGCLANQDWAGASQGLTEFCGCQNPFVEDNNAGAAGNPDTARASTSQYRNPRRRCVEAVIAVTSSAATDITATSRTWDSVGWSAGVPKGHVRDVDGGVKAAGLGRRRSGFLSEHTALELPLLLARVPLVFLCCRHDGGGFGDSGRHVETRPGRIKPLMTGGLGVVSGTRPTPGERTTRSSGGAAGSWVMSWRGRGCVWRGGERIKGRAR